MYSHLKQRVATREKFQDYITSKKWSYNRQQDLHHTDLNAKQSLTGGGYACVLIAKPPSM